MSRSNDPTRAAARREAASSGGRAPAAATPRARRARNAGMSERASAPDTAARSVPDGPTGRGPDRLGGDPAREGNEPGPRGHAPPDRMKMPHERDESAGPSASAEPPGATAPHGGREVIRQAHDDLRDGQQDTDCRTSHPGSERARQGTCAPGGKGR